jgi:hypothetical protein
MKSVKICLSLLIAGGILAYSIGAMSAQAVKPKGVKPGVIEATALNKEGTYCHLKFPAIDPTTFTSAKPSLKPVSEGDIVDFYGPCDHDPVGYDELCRQRVAYSRQQYCDE